MNTTPSPSAAKDWARRMAEARRDYAARQLADAIDEGRDMVELLQAYREARRAWEREMAA